MSLIDYLRGRGYPEDPDFSIPLGPHTCPECGESTGVYVRSDHDLVCVSCRGTGSPVSRGGFPSARPGKDRP